MGFLLRERNLYEIIGILGGGTGPRVRAKLYQEFRFSVVDVFEFLYKIALAA
jgi:hypothetical protein